MDRDTIIRLAREVGLWEMLEGYSSEYGTLDAEEDCLPNLQRFAALVVANNPPQSWMSYQEGYEAGKLAEREECAQLAKQWDADHPSSNYGGCIANLIRSRGT